jgi:DNA polymerase I-like protein with 3'-5' exonuclease and polymerase domains
MYGCAGPKLASTLGLPVKMGNDKLEAFWDANPATKALKENLEKYWASTGREKYLPAIDGRMLCTRKKSALLNTIFQSCGGISMDYALCFMDAWLGGLKWKDRKPYYIYKGHLVMRVCYQHDEVEFECEEEIAEEISRMIEKAIEKAGLYLKLKVPLAGEGKTGKSWMEVH